eukprot:5152173-Prymnesium_polylepis.1
MAPMMMAPMMMAPMMMAPMSMASTLSMQFVIELSEQVGVQVIILGEMLLNDVRAFSWLVIIMSLGFGFAFK